MGFHIPHGERGVYRLVETGACYGGDELMYAGITLPWVNGDFVSHIYVFQKEKEEETK